jgi:hypothetical protein
MSTTTIPPTTSSITPAPITTSTTIRPNIFAPSGSKRINSVSLSDSWNGYGVSPSGSGIIDFINLGSYVHYQKPENSTAIKINPNNLTQTSQRFELYDYGMRSSGPVTVSTTTTTTSSPSTTPTPLNLEYTKKV